MASNSSWMGWGGLPSHNASSFASIMKMTLSQMEYLRKFNYVKFWKFYLGQHWLYPRVQGESQIVVNYIKATINVKAHFLMGKGFEFTVPKGMELLKTKLDKIWGSQRRRQTIGLRIAQLGLVSGDAPVKVTLEEDTNRIRIIPLYPSYVDPIWSPLSSDERLVLDKCSIIYPKYGEFGDDGELQISREEITPDKIYYYDGNGQEPTEIKENDYGRINVIWIRNQPIAGYYYGYSEIADLIGLQTEYNEKVTDIADIVNYHASPTTIIFGAKNSNLEKSPRKVWSGLPKDARVENLQLFGDLMASVSFLERMRENYAEVAFLPQQILGKQQAISNTSASALNLQYLPLSMDRDGKIVYYGNGIIDICSCALRMQRLVEDSNDVQDKEFMSIYDEIEDEDLEDIVDVQFKEALPKDELIELDKTMRELDMGLESRRGAMIRLGSPVDKVDDKISEIEEDQQRRAMLEQQAMLQAQQGVPGPTSMGEGSMPSEETSPRVAEKAKE